MKIDASNWRLETAWPEEESGYVVAAFYEGPQRECCSLPLCKAEGWIVKPSEDEIPAAELGSFIIRACNSHAALVEALEEAMECIRIFHGPVAWEIYRARSPEMQRFRTILALAKGEK